MDQIDQGARGHVGICRCRRCYALKCGAWLDELGHQTEAGNWVHFATFTQSGTPDGHPSIGFGHCCFESFATHISVELGSRVEYVLCDQLGELHGRFHQHALLSAPGLDSYPRRELERWWRSRAGWCRVLPYQQPAAYYLGRYIGRNLETVDWRVEVGPEVRDSNTQVGRIVTATSADAPGWLFHQNFPRRKR